MSLRSHLFPEGPAAVLLWPAFPPDPGPPPSPHRRLSLVPIGALEGWRPAAQAPHEPWTVFSDGGYDPSVSVCRLLAFGFRVLTLQEHSVVFLSLMAGLGAAGEGRKAFWLSGRAFWVSCPMRIIWPRERHSGVEGLLVILMMGFLVVTTGFIQLRLLFHINVLFYLRTLIY